MLWLMLWSLRAVSCMPRARGRWLVVWQMACGGTSHLHTGSVGHVVGQGSLTHPLACACAWYLSLLLLLPLLLVGLLHHDDGAETGNMMTAMWMRDNGRGRYRRKDRARNTVLVFGGLFCVLCFWGVYGCRCACCVCAMLGRRTCPRAFFVPKERAVFVHPLIQGRGLAAPNDSTPSQGRGCVYVSPACFAHLGARAFCLGGGRKGSQLLARGPAGIGSVCMTWARDDVGEGRRTHRGRDGRADVSGGGIPARLAPRLACG